jgi:hypothetical protein
VAKLRAKSRHPGHLQHAITDEWFLGISLATTGTFLMFGER